jgi:hypothetical protein
MKRLLLAGVVLALAADLALAQAGSVCLFSDPQGTNCTISDPAVGLIQVYVFHMNAPGVRAVEFTAPVPACMTNAVYLGEAYPWPLVIGNTQTGVSIGYADCLSSPIHVCTISLFGVGQSQTDCPYTVLPHPMSGTVSMTDCDNNLLVGSGGTTFVNSTLPCICGPEGPPLLDVIPMTVDFGGTATAKSFLILNAGGGVLTWELSESVPWLDATPMYGTGGGSVTVHVDRSGLAPGYYSGLIDVTSSGGNATVTVNMQVLAPNPILLVSPASLSFGALETGKTLNIYNAGTGELNWTVTSTAAWLSAEPLSGTDDGHVSVTVDRTGLADGTYQADLLVESNGGDGTVPVVMLVNTQPVLYVTPTVLVFVPGSGSRQFLIRNTGYGTLEWSLRADQPWIDILPPLSGTGDATVTVNVDPDLIPEGGTQTGSVTVSSNGGTQAVTIRYEPSGPVVGGMIGLFADPSGTNCNILDNQAGPLRVYVVHHYAVGVAAVQFAAPMPSCMTAATWLSDECDFPVTVGNSQAGIAVAYGMCLSSPIQVLSILYFAQGVSQTCCVYRVVPDPEVPSGRIEVSDCNFNVIYGTGDMSVVNPDETCPCTADIGIKVEEATWGHIKALYAPE